MTDPSRPGAEIELSSLLNFRDLGGWPTGPTTRVRRGLLYRSTGLDQLAPADGAALVDLGIRTVFDLRTHVETTDRPDLPPPGMRYFNLDVMAASVDTSPSHDLATLTDPELARERLGDGQAARRFLVTYRELVSLDSARVAYRELFRSLARQDRLAGLVHCTTGKDRTGWASAALLLLLGVSEEDVFHDYLLTNEQLLPKLQPVLDNFSSLGGDPELLRPLLGVRREYLAASLAEVERQYGTIEDYFAAGLGLDAGFQESLRETFTERTGAGT